MTLWEMLSEAATDAHQTAVLQNRAEINYRDFCGLVAKLSQYYETQVPANSRVVMLAPNSIYFAASFFALARIGAEIIPVDPTGGDEDISDALLSMQATHLATCKGNKDRARMILRENWLSDFPILEIDQADVTDHDSQYQPAKERTPKGSDPLLLIKTRGTSRPKRFVSLTHDQVTSHVKSLMRPYELSKRDSFLTTLSWAHPFAMTHGLLLPFLGGATCIVDPRLPAEKWIDFLMDTHITRMIDLPYFFLNLMVNCRHAKYTLPDLKSITVGLGILPPMLRKLYGASRIPVLHCYGQAEHFWTIAMEDVKTANMMGSLKMRCLPGIRCKISDGGGKDVLTTGRKDGRLHIHSSATMKGYLPSRPKGKSKLEIEEELRRQVKTTDVLQNGWLDTGDAVSLDGAGDAQSLCFLGRMEDCFFLNKHVATPYIIDAVLRGQPGVQDCAGFPVKTESGKIMLGCAVVKKQESTLNETGVMRTLKKVLPPHYMPIKVAFVPEIPKDDGGNPLRFVIGRQFDGLKNTA